MLELQVCLTSLNVNLKCIYNIPVWTLTSHLFSGGSLNAKDFQHFPLLLVNTFVFAPQVLRQKECLVLVAK